MNTSPKAQKTTVQAENDELSLSRSKVHLVGVSERGLERKVGA